jgi:hypothetical protein
MGGRSGRTPPRASGKRGTGDPGGERQQTWDADIRGEFEKRLGRLEPVFAELENLKPAPGAAPRPGMFPKPPRRWEVVTYLVYLLWRPASEPPRLVESIRNDPRRVEKKVFALLHERIRPESSSPLMKAIFRDALHHRYRYSSKCRATSTTVTVLATYLWRSHPVQARYKSSDVYRLIGKIVEEMSTPTCFACEKPHTFKNWRAVRARDQLGKGRWSERGERWRRFISRRSRPSRE